VTPSAHGAFGSAHDSRDQLELFTVQFVALAEECELAGRGLQQGLSSWISSSHQC
jgi:hypothetical protein